MKQNIFFKVIRRIYWELCRFLPIDKNKILMSSYYGRGYSDNLKYIAEELHKDKKYNIVWVVKNENEASSLPPYVTSTTLGSLDWVKQLSTSAIWIDNCRKPFVYKKKSQLYIQTYHGCAASKKIEKDAENHLGKAYVNMSKKDGASTDIMIAPDHFMTRLFHSSFWYNGPVLEFGYPRYDPLLSPSIGDIKTKVFDYFNIPPDYKVVLYAPTFRKDGGMKVYNIDYYSVLCALKEKFGCKFKFLVRLHPNIANQYSEIEYSDYIINATYYPDMQELLAGSDILIGDYSSANIDFSLKKAPVFRFAVDVEEYKNDRDMYYPIEFFPFPLAESNEQLLDNIRKFDEQKYLQRLNLFFSELGCVLEPNASLRCVNLIRDYFELGCNKKDLLNKYQQQFK